MDDDDGSSGVDMPPGDDGSPVSERTSQSWPQRLGAAVKGGLVGVALIGAAVFGLSWNEGRAVQTARSLAEGVSLVQHADPAQLDPTLEGKLVYLAGELTTGTRLIDPDFLVEIQAVRLLRNVETFQWQEVRDTRTEKRPGGGEDTITTYSYERIWSEQTINSGHFHRPAGHLNPRPRFGAFEAVAKDASLGAYHPGHSALQQLPVVDTIHVDAEAAEAVRTRFGLRDLQAVDGRFYLGVDPAFPAIGDTRVSFKAAPVGPATFIGRQAGAEIAPFRTKAGDSLLLGAPGLVPASDLFQSAADTNTAITWLLRAVLLLLMSAGWRLLFQPLAVFADIVPIVGTIVEFGLGPLSTLLTLLLGPLVMALAWLWFRPLSGLSVLAVAVGLTVILWRWAAARLQRASGTVGVSSPMLRAS